MNRAPVNGPVDDPTCNYNTGRDKPGESVSSSPGQTSAKRRRAGWSLGSRTILAIGRSRFIELSLMATSFRRAGNIDGFLELRLNAS